AERRYADLTLLVRPDFRHTVLQNFLFEFKYLKLSHVNLSGEKLKQLSLAELEALKPVKEKLAESKKQLLDYRTDLELKYDNVFKLQLISVVAVGFDRLLWKKI
ncbi:AAA family ATPase, partial [Candidatus Marithioploca araucensis]|nr:AAA family ATPase [Candidatus Marithioploca araucensis]